MSRGLDIFSYKSGLWGVGSKARALTGRSPRERPVGEPGSRSRTHGQVRELQRPEVLLLLKGTALSSSKGHNQFTWEMDAPEVYRGR